MEIKSREQHKVVITELAQQRIKDKQCPACGKPQSEWDRRIDWRCCSNKCTTTFSKEQVLCWGWPDLKGKCHKRDNNTCKMCGKQPLREEIKYHVEDEEWLKMQLESNLIKGYQEEVIQGRKVFKVQVIDTLIADHITPIALGGAQWDINNLQTLCQECNKIKTKKDQGDIAKVRSIIKKQDGNKTIQEVINGL